MGKGTLLSYSLVTERAQLCSDLQREGFCMLYQSVIGWELPWEVGSPNLPGKVALISQGQLS